MPVTSSIFLVKRRPAHLWTALAAFLLFALALDYHFNAETAPSRLTRLLSSDYSDDPPAYTAAVLYLISGDRTDTVLTSLGKMQRHVAWRRQWPILLFHTGEFDSEESQTRFYEDMKTHEWSDMVYLSLKQRIEFIKFDFAFPPGVSSDINVYKPEEFAHRWPGESQALQ